MKGFRTIAFGAAMAVAPVLLNYLAGVHWTDYVSPEWAGIIVGGIVMALRAVTTTPVGKAIIVFAIGSALALGAAPREAMASDVNSPATKAIQNALASSACTPTSCSGWYVGGGLGGVGTNLNVIGNGLNGSAFAGGMLPTIKFGYLYAKNGWLFGAESSNAYQTNTTTTANGLGGNQNGLLLTQGVKFGGNFAQLFGSNFTSPVTIPPSLANAVINIYGQAGTAQHQLVGNQFASGEYGGAGILFDVGPHSFVDIDYKNIQYGATKSGSASFNSENVITASWVYKF